MKISPSIISTGCVLAISGIGNAARIGTKNEGNIQYEPNFVSAKPYLRDESQTIVESNVHGNEERKDISCQSDERVFNIQVKTDAYGYENSFILKLSNAVVAKEPFSNAKWDDHTLYSFSYCVKAGKDYTFKFDDLYNDGMCCEFGNGYYKFGIDGDYGEKYTVQKSHSISVPPMASSSSSSSGQDVFGGRASDSEGCINIEILPDSHPEETSWKITDSSGNTVASEAAGAYVGVTKATTKKVCLPDGKYEWTIMDTYGDGICCGAGNGHFKAYLDGYEVWRGGHFEGRKSYTFRIGFNPSMSERDEKYLIAHNTRRQTYHKKYGAEYVPLKWSPALADQAKKWANSNTLLNACGVPGVEHEHGIEEGENLAKNTGNDDGMGQLYEPDLILKRWVDNEETWGWPENAHLTQALWRATRYVGCGESAKPFNGGTCRIQVCRYARAGNCAMKSYNAEQGDNWKKPMLEDHTRCAPECPPEGCF